jgi:hypothetical protein
MAMSKKKNTEINDIPLTEEEIIKAKKKKRAAIYDKITTGILIFLMSSPVLILGYIFLWFYMRTLA